MKVVGILAFTALLSVVACRGKSSEKDHVAIAKGMFEAFNRHDWKAMADYYTDSAAFLDPALGPSYVRQSHEQIVSKYKSMESAFADIHDEVTGIYPSGDRVTIEFVSTGTGPDGVRFELPIACVLTIENGKIVKDATYYDQ